MSFEDQVKRFLPHLGVLMPGWKAAERPRPPVVAIFGKHPGWSDHITLPLETPALRNLWQTLYNTAIRSLIERGTWSQPAAGDLLPFGHLFITGQKSDWVVGRLWTSSDKVGRCDYPMAACMDFADSSPSHAIESAAPILQELENSCRCATGSADVLSSLEEARTQAANILVSQPSALQVMLPSTNLQDANQALMRVMFPWAGLLARGMGQRIFSRQKISSAPPVRVPISASTPQAALARWAQFCSEIAGPRYAMFLAVPDGQPSVDIILGRPDPTDLAVLRRPADSFESIIDAAEQEYSRSYRRWALAKLSRVQTAGLL